MRIEFLDETQIELDEAIEYYDNEVEGLGKDFSKKFCVQLIELLSSPMLGMLFLKIPEGTRQEGSHTV